MFDFFLDKVVPVVLLAMFMIASTIATQGAASFSIPGGPAMVVPCCLLAALVVASLGGYIGYSKFDLDDCKRPVLASFIVAAITFAPGLVFTGYIVVQEHKEAILDRWDAPRVQAFAFKHFDQIDCNHDEMITDGEIARSMQDPQWSQNDLTFLQYMRVREEVEGHVIDSRSYTSTVLMPVGKVMVPVSQTHKVYVFGISRADLQAYPARVMDKYKMW